MACNRRHMARHHAGETCKVCGLVTLEGAHCLAELDNRTVATLCQHEPTAQGDQTAWSNAFENGHLAGDDNDGPTIVRCDSVYDGATIGRSVRIRCEDIVGHEGIHFHSFAMRGWE